MNLQHAVLPKYTALRKKEKCTKSFSNVICIPASFIYLVATHVPGILQVFPSLFCFLQPPLTLLCFEKVDVQDACSHNNAIYFLWLHSWACVQNPSLCCQNAKGTLHNHSGRGQSVVFYFYFFHQPRWCPGNCTSPTRVNSTGPGCSASGRGQSAETFKFKIFHANSNVRTAVDTTLTWSSIVPHLVEAMAFHIFSVGLGNWVMQANSVWWLKLRQLSYQKWCQAGMRPCAHSVRNIFCHLTGSCLPELPWRCVVLLDTWWLCLQSYQTEGENQGPAAGVLRIALCCWLCLGLTLSSCASRKDNLSQQHL